LLFAFSLLRALQASEVMIPELLRRRNGREKKAIIAKSRNICADRLPTS
jgi:hypothetical protein